MGKLVHTYVYLCTLGPNLMNLSQVSELPTSGSNFKTPIFTGAAVVQRALQFLKFSSCLGPTVISLSVGNLSLQYPSAQEHLENQGYKLKGTVSVISSDLLTKYELDINIYNFVNCMGRETRNKT